MISVTISDDALVALDALCDKRGLSRGLLLDELIADAAKRERI